MDLKQMILEHIKELDEKVTWHHWDDNARARLLQAKSEALKSLVELEIGKIQKDMG